MLIVVSDGFPQDDDDGPDPADLDDGLLDTAQALREAQCDGIATFNVSVDAAATDDLRRICPPHRDAVVDDADALPARLLELCRRIGMATL